MAERQKINREDVEMVFDSPYIRVADLQYAPGRHYYDATRRTTDDLTATDRKSVV